MLKWNQHEHEGTLFEAFLPEHDGEAQQWLLRASRNGHVLAERTVELLWRPTFGPDAGDAAALEVALEELIAELASKPATQPPGDYTPGPIEVPEPDPFRHAVLYAMLEDYRAAAQSLDLTIEQGARLLGLPDGVGVELLYPLAVTEARWGRMHQVVALARLARSVPEVRSHVDELIGALVAGDVARMRDALERAGVPTQNLS